VQAVAKAQQTSNARLSLAHRENRLQNLTSENAACFIRVAAFLLGLFNQWLPLIFCGSHQADSNATFARQATSICRMFRTPTWTSAFQSSIDPSSAFTTRAARLLAGIRIPFRIHWLILAMSQRPLDDGRLAAFQRFGRRVAHTALF